MLLVVDCKHKLIAKSPRRTASNGTAKSNKNEKGEKSEREDLLEVDAEMQIEDPSLPPVSCSVCSPVESKSVGCSLYLSVQCS